MKCSMIEADRELNDIIARCKEAQKKLAEACRIEDARNGDETALWRALSFGVDSIEDVIGSADLVRLYLRGLEKKEVCHEQR